MKENYEPIKSMKEIPVQLSLVWHWEKGADSQKYF